MSNNFQHIETAVISGSPGGTYGHMYSMHKYWSKKSPDVAAAYIENYTKPGDIVLDPFCGSGIIASEAVRLGRRAIAIDLNPVATFITRMTLTPVNLSRLRGAFEDIREICEGSISELFPTRCSRCGKNAEIEFVVIEGESPIQIAYKCSCSDSRLFKKPDILDNKFDLSFEKRKIPFWYPHDVPLPRIRREKFRFLHELFTKRNLIALSIILNTIEKLEDEKIRDIMKLTFTASLAKCSRLKPLSGREAVKAGSRPSLQEGWIAVRFYAPKMWQEVNPWHAFRQSFDRVYKAKQESNAKLKYVAFGSSYDDLISSGANILIFTGSAEVILNRELPEGSVHYILTDPPYGEDIPYLALSTFWGAWLKFHFDYDNELIVNRELGKTIDSYLGHFGLILRSIRRVMSPNKYINFFYHDIQGPYLHGFLKLMAKSKIKPRRVLHQPPSSSFSAKARIKGYIGDYIISGQTVQKNIRPTNKKIENSLQKKVFEAARATLEIREGNAPVGILLHSIYQKLNGNEILAFAQFPAEEYLKNCIKDFALIKGPRVELKIPKVDNEHNMIEEIGRALLDAKSLYINDPSGDTKKNQIYQQVLHRFEEHRITVDYIRSIEDKKILKFEEIDHRRNRLPQLLQTFGEILNFKCSRSGGTVNEISWEYGGDVMVIFKITDKEIFVRASKKMPEKNIISDMGIISDRDLEKALYKWCENNPTRGQNLMKMLHPLENPIENLEPATSYKHLLLKVLTNEELCPNHYLITLEIKKNDKIDPLPGQFFHIICDPDCEKTKTTNERERGYALTLRRPFSVHGIHYVNFDRRMLATPTITPYEIREVIRRPVSKIDILYKIVGKGTESLSRVIPGKWIDVIGPVGNAFNIENVKTAVIIAGGIGVAPLVALAERLRYLDSQVYLYFGALRKDILLPILIRPDSIVELGYANGSREFADVIDNEFKKIGTARVKLCTDDGSLGEKGLVTDILEKDLTLGNLPRENITIFACGPSKMMEAVSHIALKNKFPCQVLLEQRMACGIGACLSCTCHVRGENGKMERKRVCIDGPVFNSRDIIWQP